MSAPVEVQIERFLALASEALREWDERRIDMTMRPPGLDAHDWYLMRARAAWAEYRIEDHADYLAKLFGYGPRDGAL
ncbi:hypothetical protein ABZX88_35465 [Kitasatospora aureofaciens]|uniref:hypothetical protein n=1 Tax=Kitasatospora aureofaciens TaxID=1894 RepID=UPI0033A5A330